MKDKRITGYILIFLFISYLIFNFTQNKNSDFNAKLISSDLEISFPNNIFVKDYVVKDFERNTSNEYKIVMEQKLYQDVAKIVIKDISNYNIQPNHAYFYQMAQDNSKEPTKQFKTLGFCIKINTVILQKSREKDTHFIDRCHQPEM